MIPGGAETGRPGKFFSQMTFLSKKSLIFDAIDFYINNSFLFKMFDGKSPKSRILPNPHLRNKKFLLKFLSQQNASKFAIFHI